MENKKMRAVVIIALGASVVMSAQRQAPIKREYIPSHPAISSPPVDHLSSSLVAEMMPFVAPLVIETTEVSSKLVLANSSNESTFATVTLYSTDGSKSDQQRVTFLPHEKKELPMSSIGAGLASNERWGSIMVEQDPHKAGVVVAGQVVVSDLRSSVPAYVDEELAMPEMVGSNQLVGVTDQSEAPPLVAITNLSSELQHVSVLCDHDAKEPRQSTITLASHATLSFKGCSDGRAINLSDYTAAVTGGHERGVFGLQVEGDGLPGSLAAFGLAPHFRGRDMIFSSVPFSDPQLIHSVDTVFAGVPIGIQQTLPYGTYVPHMSYTNFSNLPIHLSVYLADTPDTYSQESNSTLSPLNIEKLRTITVPAHTGGEYIFNGMEAKNGLLHSVQIKADGSPGQYQTKLVSRSDGRLYQIELLAKDAMDINNSGIHPWSIDDDTESHLILFNHTPGPRTVGFSIISGANLWRHEFTLAAFETREISFNAIEKEKTLDDFGRTLPLTAKEGVVNWMSPESGYVTGRLMVTSRANAMARNFSCGGVIVLCGINFATYDEFITAGETLYMYGDEQDDFCTASEPLQCSGTGAGTEGTASHYWTVGATSIIALNASTEASKTLPLLKGVSAGSGKAQIQVNAGGCSDTGTGDPTVQVPTADPVVSTNSSQARSCPTGTAGWDREVTKQLVDQNGDSILGAGHSLTETFTIGSPNQLNMVSIQTGTGTTNATGQLEDDYWVCADVCAGAGTSGQTVATQHGVDTPPGSSTQYTLTPNSIAYMCKNITINGK
jgi:hypothetical protein